jgi:hypothetical protein
MSQRSFFGRHAPALCGGAVLGRLVLATLALFGPLGCGDEEPPINRVGVNVVEKSLFQDSWYMSRTVIDVDYEGSALGTFPGDAASDAAQTFTAMPRIEWRIDKNTLFAYRDYELTPGGDGEWKGPKPETERPGVHEPVAAFAIEKHFDIRRDFNPSTGEEQNVIVENDTDNRWYEREFMRVDWSKNLLPGFYGQTYNLNELMGVWKREPADLYVQAESAFPDSWQPRFDRMACDGSGDESEACSDDERDLADDYDKDELYHMSFVTQEVLSPGLVTEVDSATGQVTGKQANWCAQKIYSDAPACSSVASYVRTSFLKVSDKREYEPVDWSDNRFERFGYFRLSQDVVDRSTGDPSDPAYFYTDFLNYNINRHNLWKKWRDSDGKPLAYSDRDVRQIVWYTTPELPAHLVRPSFDVVGEWNEVFMSTVRTLRGEAPASYPEVDCQEDDPDGYCYCQKDPSSGQVLRPSCPGRYDPFTPPDGYGSGTQDPYDCYVRVPEDAEPDFEAQNAVSDADFNGWFGAEFVGDECATVLRINSCNRATIAKNGGTADGLACQERGDLRFKFLSYVDQPGTGFLGIATLRGDPVTGEIITGDANIGGPALDSFRTSALLTYDLVHGTLDDREIIAGEDVRQYFEQLGHVDLPARPRTDFTVATTRGDVPNATTRSEIDNRMQTAMAKLSRLQGPEGRNNVFSDRRQKLIGTDLERRLVSGPDGLVAAGMDVLPANGALTDDQMALASPFRTSALDQLRTAQQLETKLSRANVEMPNEYVDDSVQWFVDKHLDWSRARLEFGVNRLLFRQTQLHELGHCYGLRHDFGGTVDSEHYAPEYYAIDERIPLPDPDDFDVDGDTSLDADEQLELERAYDDVQTRREQAGIDTAMSSSVMDYTANWYQRISPLGRYDRAAIAFGYGDLVEAYRGEKAPDAEREMLLGYQGGEVCETDADCPFAADGERAHMLLGSNMAAGLSQRCVPNPRVAGAKLCSSFDSDLAAAVDQGDSELTPLQYRFCTDDRADSTLAWCNRFDEGASYREIVRNVAEDYERVYPFAAFRRYRKGFSISSYRDGLLGRRLGVLQNIYQNLLFEYSSDPAFREQTGPLGFYDQFLATTDILNFYGKVLATPNVGGYVLDDREQTYFRGFIAPDAPAAELSIPLGMGRYFNSDYQAGLSGIQRIERVGSFFDKVWVLQLMTQRGGAADYTRDVAFFANFYDLFPNELQQIWNGMIRGFPSAYMPRIVCPGGGSACANPRLQYMDFYRGDCSKPETCRPNPEVTYGGLPVLNGGGSLSLQIYAAAFGLQDFPVFFDTSFQNQLMVCIEGQGDCFEPDPDADQGVDYVRYTSPRYRRSFLAFQVEPAVGVGEQTSIGFAMVKEARDLDAILNVLAKLPVTMPEYDVSQLTAEDLALLDELGYELPDGALGIDAEIDRITGRVFDLESFFNQLIELQRDFGIQSFRYW